MLGRFFVATTIAAFLFWARPMEVRAVTPPDFPSCPNPGGILKVDYPSGTHGIAGRTGDYQGSDTVYTLGDTTLSQCFCSANDQGVQTNWWKVSSLTEDQINTLRAAGWDYVANGAVWGLEGAPYLASSSDYPCGGEATVAATSPGQVLGLATTGNLGPIAALIGSGGLFLALSFLARRRANI